MWLMQRFETELAFRLNLNTDRLDGVRVRKDATVILGVALKTTILNTSHRSATYNNWERFVVDRPSGMPPRTKNDHGTPYLRRRLITS